MEEITAPRRGTPKAGGPEPGGGRTDGASRAGDHVAEAEQATAILAALGQFTAALNEVTAKVASLETNLREAGRPCSSEPVEPLWTRQDVADYLQCSLRFVDSLIADNRLVGVAVGGLKRFDRHAVEAMVKGGPDRRLRRTRAKAR